MYDFVSIGNYTKDTIVSIKAGTRQVDGGGFNYAAHAAVMMGLKTAAITRLAKEDFHVVENLKKIGADVFAEATPHSTLMKLEYPTADVDHRILTVTSTAGSFTPEQINAVDAKAFLISASIRGEMPLQTVKALRKKKALIAADVQGFIRVVSPKDGQLLYERNWPEKEAVLELIDVLKTDAVESEAITGEKDIKKAAKMLAEYGPKEIVLTHRDGLLVYAEGKYYEAGFHPKELIGRSGRGDTCIGSYTAKRLSASPKDSCVWAAALTSLKMEAEGPIKRKVSEVEELIRTRYKK
ncbi:MAG TPA: hypothetical protein VGL10_06995 [Gammaproteobacteria bacterium]